jgi:hypothetical protein
MALIPQVIGKTLFASCVIAAVLLSNEAGGTVTFRLSGTVIEADEGTLPEVGDAITGFVVLTDEAVASSPPDEFALGHGDVLDIYIEFGPYIWDLSRPSVYWAQFEGFLTGDKQAIGNYSLNLIENFFGVISDEYCLPTEVCQMTAGGNGIMALHDGRGTSIGLTSWEVCSPFPGGGATGGCFPGPGSFPLSEPGVLALIVLGLAGLGLANGWHRIRRRGGQLARWAGHGFTA